ncbi:Protein-ribulosamine 3-kinase [Durusdinium trenchii]|uniref:protein-ribulosamine 3-kinase n=3 Tax=Durusdinium trenchii TaxID=1381693 RepID=A0ABP0JWM3_9DINO
METYEALLKSQLKQLEEVLLRRHQAEFHALKQQYLLGVEKGAPGLSEDCGQNDEIPQERWCLERTRAVKRWESFSWKLLARQESSFDTEESIIAVRSSSERPDLRMRSSWCHSVMQKRVKMPPSSRNSYTEDMILRMNEEMTSSSWYSKFVFGPQSSFQLLWAVLSIILITWDLVTIPLEVFDNSSFHEILKSVGYGSLAYWVVDMPLHLLFGVQKGGIVELRPRVLARLYLKTWFPVDLALVALDVLLIVFEIMVGEGSFSGAFRSVRVLRIMRILRLLRLLRVAKLQRELSIIANRFISAYVFMVMKLVCIACGHRLHTVRVDRATMPHLAPPRRTRCLTFAWLAWTAWTALGRVDRCFAPSRTERRTATVARMASAAEWLEGQGYDVAGKQGRGGLEEGSSTFEPGSSWASFQTLQTDQGDFFVVKTARRPAADMFKGEALGLEALRAAGGVCVPKVLHYDDDGSGGSYIIMEKLNMGGRVNMKDFGRKLAEMHLAEPAHPEAKSGKFGFQVDNTIGGTPQKNAWTEDWASFVKEQRLGPQVRMAGSGQLTRVWKQLLEETGDLRDLFSDVEVKPSILHGDLWSGNYQGTPDGVAIFDPATYYGHHEAEFGMSWCAGFNGDFWSGYREVIPEAPKYRQRAKLYEAYHIINHYNLFGGGYLQQGISLLEALLK